MYRTAKIQEQMKHGKKMDQIVIVSLRLRFKTYTRTLTCLIQ